MGGGFYEVQVQPLTEKQIVPLVEKAYGAYYEGNERRAAAQSQELMAGIRRLDAERRNRLSEDEPSLISTPLMVRLLLIVHLDDGQMPKHRAQLYEQAVERLLFPNYGPDEEAQTLLKKLIVDDKQLYHNMMQHIALAMHVRGRSQGRTITKDELAGLLAVSPYAGYMQPLLALAHARGGLLDERAERYQFMHLALQEFLVARYVAEVVRTKGGMPAIVAYLQQNALGATWWREVILLTAGYLFDRNREFAADLALQLAMTAPAAGADADAPFHAAELAAATCLEWVDDDNALRRTIQQRLVELIDDETQMRRATPRARSSRVGVGAPGRSQARRGFAPRWAARY